MTPRFLPQCNGVIEEKREQDQAVEVARVMRLMEAIFESAEKKQVIKFEA